MNDMLKNKTHPNSSSLTDETETDPIRLRWNDGRRVAFLFLGVWRISLSLTYIHNTAMSNGLTRVNESDKNDCNLCVLGE